MKLLHTQFNFHLPVCISAASHHGLCCLLCRFVSLVAELERRGTFAEHGVTPLLCGSANDDFAVQIKKQFMDASSTGVLEERFLGATQMAELYAATRLNVHPCLYDAYGMTIVEAASQVRTFALLL